MSYIFCQHASEALLIAEMLLLFAIKILYLLYNFIISHLDGVEKAALSLTALSLYLHSNARAAYIPCMHAHESRLENSGFNY